MNPPNSRLHTASGSRAFTAPSPNCRAELPGLGLALAALASLLVLTVLRTSGADQPNPSIPKKIVLIADHPDGHAAGTHEYAKGVRLLKHCLDTSANVRGIRTEAHFGGWPEDPRTLEDADSILLYTTGSDKGKH